MQKKHCFVQYTPKKGFNGFIQSVVDARRAGDKSPESEAVTETMELIGNTYIGYQITDRSRHTETKSLSDE